jgi:hypothetical protein
MADSVRLYVRLISKIMSSYHTTCDVSRVYMPMHRATSRRYILDQMAIRHVAALAARKTVIL